MRLLFRAPHRDYVVRSALKCRVEIHIKCVSAVSLLLQKHAPKHETLEMFTPHLKREGGEAITVEFPSGGLWTARYPGEGICTA